MTVFNREFLRKRDLLWLLTKKEVTLKYKRTYLGILWSLLNPIILGFILFVAFTIFLRFNIENYTFFLLSALFPWNAFSASITMASGLLIRDIQLVKRVRCPRHFLVISTVLSQLINLLFALPVIAGLSFYYGTGPGLAWIAGIPILMALTFMATVGFSFAVSILNAYFRDMEYLIGVLITFLFWMTPIVYPLDAVPDPYKTYLAINPLSHLISAWRNLFISNTLNWENLSVSLMTSLAFLLLGSFIFQHLGKRLDEVI